MIITLIHEPRERPQLLCIIRGGWEKDSAQYLMLGLQNCAVRSGCSSFSITTFVTPSAKIQRKLGASAHFQGTDDGVGTWRSCHCKGVVYLLLVVEILAAMVTMMGGSMISPVVFGGAGRPTAALSANLST